MGAFGAKEPSDLGWGGIRWTVVHLDRKVAPSWDGGKEYEERRPIPEITAADRAAPCRETENDTEGYEA